MQGAPDRDLLADLAADLASAGRVCPSPRHWHDFWLWLSKAGATPPEPRLVPLILGAWWYTSDLEKSLRFMAQVEWAADHGVIEEAAAFLRALPLDAWHPDQPGRGRTGRRAQDADPGASGPG